ncbi:unnamed protein product [Paramecium octaurelia]|uniref:Uncharacterized protein n=1 Tax=Paramecium octaurelia TaxID=43137 RepID=A0A8S1Y917_PAROT|nr:unnamed protein product [Paramecium octaurelia]
MLLFSLRKIMKLDKRLINAFKILLNKIVYGFVDILTQRHLMIIKNDNKKEDGIKALLKGFFVEGLSFMTLEENFIQSLLQLNNYINIFQIINLI